MDGILTKDADTITHNANTTHNSHRTSQNTTTHITQHNTQMINKASELAFESIPGCVLQLYVWLDNPKEAGTYALVSIGISAATTGFTSAMMSFDFDVDVSRRKNQPKFYGYIPDDHALRGRCFVLMTVISSLHNLSRSVGVALLATNNDKLLAWIFVGGEIGLYLGERKGDVEVGGKHAIKTQNGPASSYRTINLTTYSPQILVYKALRRDWRYWIRVEGLVSVLSSLICRVSVKVIVDYSGCIHFRHPFELGGAGFSLSMLWAQAFPFVALQFYDVDEEMKSRITIFLGGSFGLWVALNVMFFCTVDLSYVHTFFGTMTGPQYSCKMFLETEEDSLKWDAVFTNRIQYTESIHGEVKEWVKANIDTWKSDNPEWFVIEKIPDDFLPKEMFEAEGGAKRRRSSLSLREIIGGTAVAPSPKIEEDGGKSGREVVPVQGESSMSPNKTGEKDLREAWKKMAADVYDTRSGNYKSNIAHVRRLFGENEELLKPLLTLCPQFMIILCFILEVSV